MCSGAHLARHRCTEDVVEGQPRRECGRRHPSTSPSSPHHTCTPLPQPGMSTSVQMEPMAPVQTTYDQATFDDQKDTPLLSRADAPDEAGRKRSDAIERLSSDGLEPLYKRLPDWVPIVCWISTSSILILWNKHILFDLGFSHPVVRTPARLLPVRELIRFRQALTTIHLLVCRDRACKHLRAAG